MSANVLDNLDVILILDDYFDIKNKKSNVLEEVKIMFKAVIDTYCIFYYFQFIFFCYIFK